ncbi:NAD-dependent epimerase/dehydratase family protein [Paenibacillus sp. MMS20-IR301]|uniref:NAD-dependent epimerase/dehydratase family protein n=1 Tax=Paenibacillus sp. MMS20-IR301 TaxID=2895946 RepID=UPI0028E36EEE|nr:NAD-dependent epimerase/dehydratase family protein [Paenibacillus sp. MMS20-IR301]WNS42731.1 NAD-dependent epimerase/dehydratase family protein [Paenibacillus sp. MMS20-IR301]
MRILVMGGAGFIGSNIVDQLLLENHEVGIVDNLLTGKKENINSKAIFFDMDLNSPMLERVFETFSPEVVLHLAAQVNVAKSIRDPLLDQEINIRGTVSVLEKCKKYNVRKIIYSSSAAVYGIPKNEIIDEDHPTDPISFYGISKLVPEYYIRTYSKLYGLQYSILRYSNVFGPRQDHMGEAGVISIFANQIINNKEITIFGNGEQTRDFIYVQDVVNANISAIHSEVDGIYNISTNCSITLNDLVRKMDIQSGKSTEIRYEDERMGDIQHSCLDNRAAIKALGWKPVYSIEYGLKETINYHAESSITEKNQTKG